MAQSAPFMGVAPTRRLPFLTTPSTRTLQLEASTESWLIIRPTRTSLTLWPALAARPARSDTGFPRSTEESSVPPAAYVAEVHAALPELGEEIAERDETPQAPAFDFEDD